MITILAEKPSVAREIARIVGAMKREEGYFTGNGYHVTWALGHLVQLALPDGYGIKGFRRDSLPVIPKNFELIPRQVKTDKGYKADAAAVKQIKVITKPVSYTHLERRVRQADGYGMDVLYGLPLVIALAFRLHTCGAKRLRERVIGKFTCHGGRNTARLFIFPVSPHWQMVRN